MEIDAAKEYIAKRITVFLTLLLMESNSFLRLNEIPATMVNKKTAINKYLTSKGIPMFNLSNPNVPDRYVNNKRDNAIFFIGISTTSLFFTTKF